MPLPNRVLPTGEIIAHSARGTLTGNRGVLHDEARTLRRPWAHRHWIACRLDWNGIRRTPMTPGRWTELFFLDECVALAAGHRPCALCRRADYRRWGAAWAAAFGDNPIAAAMDRALHDSRVDHAMRSQRLHLARAQDLPDGVFIASNSGAALIRGAFALPFHPEGYAAPLPRPEGTVRVMTPAVTVAVLAAGYAPLFHPSAEGAASAPPA
jgi:hypothetical protein